MSTGLAPVRAGRPAGDRRNREPTRADQLEVGFNVSYLLDALAAIDSEKVEIELTDANSSCLIRSPGNTAARYVVMPMRL